MLKTHRATTMSLDYVEIQLNRDTLEVRHVVTTSPLRKHAGFTSTDLEAGWEQISACPADGLTESDIDLLKSKAVARSREFWLDLASSNPKERVVVDGEHYTLHEAGVGIGFDGDVFTVVWLDQTRPQVRANLSYQGKVPGWLRENLPDNAVITDRRAI